MTTDAKVVGETVRLILVPERDSSGEIKEADRATIETITQGAFYDHLDLSSGAVTVSVPRSDL